MQHPLRRDRGGRAEKNSLYEAFSSVFFHDFASRLLSPGRPQ
jgi:hypothetical protein